MKFDFCIGNPPYQDETLGDNEGFAPPIYNKFIDAACEVADKVELIHPARFLFRQGSTPKAWNEKILQDPHFKVLEYEEDASKIFANTDIKGGVVVTYRDRFTDFGAISVFTKYEILSDILKKVLKNNSFVGIDSIIYIQNRYNLGILFSEHPEVKTQIGSNGTDPRFEKNAFSKISMFSEDKSANSIKVVGILDGKRTWRFIEKKYVDLNHENLDKYKVVIPVANGTGEFGQTLSTPVLEGPSEAYTRSFIGIGSFNAQNDAANCLSYLKTKFARAMLHILKVTQMANKDVWKYVPLQDFSPQSDIDWSKSIIAIDQQLYKKYGLSKEEIDFIETHVKEMA